LIFRSKGYDYNELARKICSINLKQLSLDDLYLNVLKLFTQTVGADAATLVLKEKESYAVKQCLGGDGFTFRVDDYSSLINWFKKFRRPFSRQQLLEEKLFSPIKSVGLNFFIQLQSEVCVPLFDKDDFVGFITVSLKKSKKSYRGACLQVLDWLGCQFALILQNALLQEKLSLQNMELDSVKNLKTQIIANLSHELRTPLTGIVGFAELLAEEIDGPLNREQQKLVSQVLQSATRLTKILSSLVDLAKLEAGNLPLHVQQFNLAPLVASLSDEIPLGAGTAFKIHMDNHTPYIYGDLNLVRQIFKNLLDNAAKYTPRGEVQVSADKKGEMLEICVADTGIGIAEEKLHRIFEGFYQVEGGLTREFQGPGIGLALAKKLIELHGGRLWVKSQVGRGSRFYFTLPLKPIVIKHRELAA